MILLYYWLEYHKRGYFVHKMAHKEHLLRLKTFTIIFLKEKILNLKCPKFGVGFNAP